MSTVWVEVKGPGAASMSSFFNGTIEVIVNGKVHTKIEGKNLPEKPKQPEAIGSQVRAIGQVTEGNCWRVPTVWTKIGPDKWVTDWSQSEMGSVRAVTTAKWSGLVVYEVISPNPKPVISVEPENVLAIVKGSCRGCGRIEHFTKEKNPPPGERNWRCVNCGCYSTWVDLHTSDDLWVDLHTADDLPQVIYEGIKN